VIGLLFSYMIGFFHWLLLFALLHLLLQDWRKSLPVSLLAWIPWEPHFIGIMHGALGELSVGTILVSLLIFVPQPLKETPGIRINSAIIVIAGTLVYGDYLRFLPGSSFHLYEAGFHQIWLILLVGLFAIFALFRGWLWTCLWISLALLGWNLSLLESQNLWDYLIDAPLWILSIIFLLRSFRS